MATAEARMGVHDDVEEASVTRVQLAVGRGIIDITLLYGSSFQTFLIIP